MREEKITVSIGPDGTLHAETKGIKGKTCETELAELLAEIAVVNGTTPTAEAREKEPDVRVRPKPNQGLGRST